MIRKADDQELPDDEEGQRSTNESAGDSPVSPGEIREGRDVGDEYPVANRKHGDLGLLKRAVDERWPMTRRKRKRAVKRTMEHVDDPEPDISLGGLRVLVAMEGQNQKDDQPQINVSGPTIIQVVKREDWYGNRAHDLAAERAAASKAGAALPGEVQAGSQRPAVGKNGNGTAHHN